MNMHFPGRTRRPGRALPLLLVAMVVAASASAAPAAWHKWRSKHDGELVCAQVSPGKGWERVFGPFRDPQCTLPGKPGS